MRFRLFRSRAFWVGVPGLVFLLWGWVDSHSHYLVVGFKGPDRVVAGHVGEYLFVAKAKGGPMDWGSLYGTRWETPMAEALLNGMRGNPDLRSFDAPYGFVILTYVWAWSGLLIWRARKFRGEEVQTISP